MESGARLGLYDGVDSPSSILSPLAPSPTVPPSVLFYELTVVCIGVGVRTETGISACAAVATDTVVPPPSLATAIVGLRLSPEHVR